MRKCGVAQYGGEAAMSQVIHAIFEDGVFKPIEKVAVKEHERVEIRVVHIDDWQLRFDRIIKKIQKKSARHDSDEIEADILQAVKEVK
jgi:predicted DNA-binding antitoxin AbrB/MazE fold protein